VKLEIVSGSPSADDIAAIVAALQFTFAKQKNGRPPISRWGTADREYETELTLPRGWRAQPRF